MALRLPLSNPISAYARYM